MFCRCSGAFDPSWSIKHYLLTYFVREQASLKLEHKRETQRTQTDRLMKLRSELTAYREERVQIERDLQRRVQMEDTKRDLAATNDVLEAEIAVGCTSKCTKLLRTILNLSVQSGIYLLTRHPFPATHHLILA